MRQSPGKPGRKTFAAIIERLTLRAIGIDPDIAVGVHPASDACAGRRAADRATCSDAASGAASRHIGGDHPRNHRYPHRRCGADVRSPAWADVPARTEQRGHDTQAQPAHHQRQIRLLAQLGAALLAAKISGGDIGAAVEAAIGWNDLGREVDEARKLIRPIRSIPSRSPRPITPSSDRSVLVHRLVHIRGGASLPCARASRSRSCTTFILVICAVPAGTPVGFIRQAWRRAIGSAFPIAGSIELCVLVELRDRLPRRRHVGRGSRRYRAVEQQLIPAPVFANMRAAGPLPIPASDTADIWLAERHAHLTRRLAGVERKAETDMKTCSSAWAGCGFRP